MKRILAILLTALMLFGCAAVAYADTVELSTVDPSKSASLTIHKYDITAASKPAADGGIAWNSAEHAPTGLADASVEAALAPYAIQGVVYSYLKIGDMVVYSETESNGTNKVMNLFKMNDTTDAAFLAAIGMTNADAYPVQSNASNGAGAFQIENGYHYFESNVIVNKMAAALASNSTTVKNALEQYMAAQHGTEMPETNAAGTSTVSNLPQGLYLIVETKVPENVIGTTDPFLVALPTTTMDGAHWNYDVVVYPKNQTGDPSMEKTVREAKSDTGVNNGSVAIDDGYGNTASASAGDKLEYQIIAHLPVITSDATALNPSPIVDTMGKGLEFNGNEAANTAGLLNGHFDANDVVVAFYTDAACTEANKVAEWREDDNVEGTPAPKFQVAYGTADGDATTMTITFTELGRNEMNKTGSYTGRPALEQGYSQLWMRITYSATANQNADLVLGDEGNPNKVTMTWKRTNVEYTDTLTDDDTTVYSYGLSLTKKFSDNNGDFSKVKFMLHNDTDNYYVIAKEATQGTPGYYYVTGHANHESASDIATAEPNGTVFTPAADGTLVIKGLEDDTYTLTEIETDGAYYLPKEDMTIVITSTQNIDDAKAVNENGRTTRTGSATMNGDPVNMLAEGTSAHAWVPTEVMNSKKPPLPATGGAGTLAMTLAAFGGIAVLVVLFVKKKKNEEQAENV